MKKSFFAIFKLLTFFLIPTCIIAQNDVVKGIKIEMVKVDAGSYTMGDLDFDNSFPHKVDLNAFQIQKTEVTQELWEAVMGTNPSVDKSSNKKPVTNVSWDDCQLFIKKLNTLTGKLYRLPTEAEWEYAARGANKSNGYKYAGSPSLYGVAWYNDEGLFNPDEKEEKTQEVAKLDPNEIGLYDMSGNVWEWCSDWYQGFLGMDPQKNPKGPKTGTYKVIRGGGWFSQAMYCQTSCRMSYSPKDRNPDFGFRLAL